MKLTTRIVKAWRIAFDDLPECELIMSHFQIVKEFLKEYAKPFQQPFDKPFRKGLANQEQEQEQEHKDLMSSKLDDSIPGNGKTNGRSQEAANILTYLNEKAGRAYQPVEANTKLIISRLKDGASVEDMRAVIDRKCAQWLGDDKMSQYLRPATLFNAQKFAQYQGEGSGPEESWRKGML